MTPLAKLWTWTGHLFVALAIAWGFYIRGGLAEKPPPEGVIVSRAYWGVLIALAAGAALTWVFALYVRQARQQHEAVLVPPNTTFEDTQNRNLVISWGTVVAFTVAVLAALSVFAVRYGESHVHGWNDRSPLQTGFWASRSKAHDVGCANQPCFAVGQRVDASNNPLYGVNEYILYVTDGALIISSLLLIAGLAFVGAVLCAKRREPSNAGILKPEQAAYDPD